MDVRNTFFIVLLAILFSYLILADDTTTTTTTAETGTTITDPATTTATTITESITTTTPPPQPPITTTAIPPPATTSFCPNGGEFPLYGNDKCISRATYSGIFISSIVLACLSFVMLVGLLVLFFIQHFKRSPSRYSPDDSASSSDGSDTESKISDAPSTPYTPSKPFPPPTTRTGPTPVTQPKPPIQQRPEPQGPTTRPIGRPPTSTLRGQPPANRGGRGGGITRPAPVVDDDSAF